MHRAAPSGRIKRVRAWIASLLWEVITGATPRGRLCAAAVLGGTLAALGPERVARGPRLCVISAIIRRPCPACGLTRAAAALLRGDVRRAYRCNTRIIPATIIALALLARDCAAVIARRASVSQRSSRG